MKTNSRLLVLPALAATIALAMLLPGCGASTSYMDSSSANMSAHSTTVAAPPPMSPNLGGEMNAAMDQVISPETSSNSAVRTPGVKTPSTSAMLPEPGPTENAAPADEPRKLVKNGNLSLETKEFDTAIEKITQMITEMGGYVDNQTVEGKSLRNEGDYFERSAYITARIPAEKLATTTTQLGELCNITSQGENVSDITDRYYDAQSRLDVLKVKETRLLELLGKAEKLEDIISLEDALSNCQYEADRLTGQLRRMDSQVSYSTLTLTISEVVEYQTNQAAPKNFGERLLDSLQRSGKRLVNALQNTAFTIIELGPVVLLYLAIWGGILYLCYRIFVRRRLRKKATPPASAATTPPEETPE